MRETTTAPVEVDPPERVAGGRLQFRILGSLEVEHAGEPIPLGGPQQRAVLAHLIVRANELVPTDVLVDELWGDEVPESARNTIYTYMSHLRKLLGADRIEGRTPGYRLQLDPSELDATRFDKLVGDARRAEVIDPGIAATVFDEALGLWRGPALADVADDGELRAEASRLDELRLIACEERIDALLSAGGQARVITDAEVLVDRHPLRERMWRQLMLALYRDGRQAEALTAYQRVREVLADELGIDPSPELTRLHGLILKQDPSLELRGEPLRGYRLMEKIGEGPTGVVFRAIQPRVGRDVALKIVHEQLASDPSFVRRFDREAQAAAALEHPHIVPIYDYWREPGRAYLVSRYLKGGSLAARVARDGRVTSESALVVDQVASALAFAHRQGVAHGSVCAANVVFDGEGNAYLGDFRVGVGPSPDPDGDVRELASFARDLIDEDTPRRLRDLVERVRSGTERSTADAFVSAARSVAEPEPVSVPRPDDVRNPYKGLRPFTEADAQDFFGRSELTSRLVSRLAEAGPRSRFLAVVGPSGAGKSSIVRAGMVPAIRRGALGEEHALTVAEMFPGAHPIEELEHALMRVGTRSASRLHDLLDRDSRGLLEAMDLVLPAPEQLVLVVDQFEEVFTLTADEREREHFLESLRVAALDPESRLRVVVTLRADFYDRPLTYPRLGELLAARTEAVPPLAPDELEQAIRRPAEGVGIATEPGVVAELIADVAHQPGALPLVQFGLTELFEQREGDRLTLAAYQAIGGVTGALSARADRIFATTEPDGQRAIRQVFLRLVTIGDGRQDTRRRVSRRELDALDVDPSLVEMVLDTFGRHRLLTFDREPSTREPTVEIAHEALLTAWSRLRGWIDDAREDLRQDRRLARTAGEWQASGCDPSFVLRGARLEQIEAWVASTDLAIGRAERGYVKASVDLRDQEQEQERARHEREELTERRSRSRLKALVAVFAVAALVASVLTLIAVDQRQEARRQSRVGLARELAAASVANVEVDPERSVLLAMAAVDQTRSVDGSVLPEAEDALHRAIGASRIDATISGVGGTITWGPNGTFAAESAEGEGIVEIRDADTGMRLLSLAAHDGAVSGLAFSRDGTMLATTGADGNLKVWDTSTGDLRHSIGGDGEARYPAFSTDGSRVAASWRGEIATVRVAATSSGRVTRTVSVPGGPLAFDPDLRRVAVIGKDSSAIIELATGHRTGFAGGDGLVSWSPDGRYIAASSWTFGGVYDRAGRHLFGVQHDEVVSGLSWSRGSRCPVGPDDPNATCLVTVGTVTAKVWPIVREDLGVEVSVSPRFSGPIAGVALSPDGRRLMTASADTSAVKIWDVSISGDAEVANMPAAYFYSDVAFMPDGRRVARFEGEPRSIAIWDLDDGRTVRRLGPSWGELFRIGIVHPQIEVSPDGRSIAVFGALRAGVWDVASGDRTFAVQDDEQIWSVDWSPDGRQLIMASQLGWAKIVDRTGREIEVLREEDGYQVVGARFSPDGRSVAMSAVPHVQNPGLEPRTTIWDLDRGDIVATIPGLGDPVVAFSPDGARMVTMSDPGSAKVWDTRIGDRIAELPDKVNDLAYSPDGTQLAAALDDATVRLYDAGSFEQQLVLRGHAETASWVDFSPDGSMLVSGGGQGGVRVWALEIDDLLEIARNDLTRELTTEECQQYLHVDRCPS